MDAGLTAQAPGGNGGGRGGGLIPKEIRRWAKEKWKERWPRYQEGIPSHVRTAAQRGEAQGTRAGLHAGLFKVESSVGVQLRTEKIGLRAFLYKRRVPGVDSASCECGWRYQDIKHMLILCPNHAEGRKLMFERAGSDDFRQIVLTSKGLKSATEWVIQRGMLGQFTLAREQLFGNGGSG